MKKTISRRAVVARILATVLVLVVLGSCTAFLAGIWTGDDRWGFTGLLGIGLVFVTFVALILSDDLE